MIPQTKRIIEWRPHAGPQSALFVCPAEIILYGGAKGGGKTDAAIIFAAQDFDKSGYKSLLLRRNFTELERHIIPRSHQLFGNLTGAHYDSRNHRWEFRTPDGGQSMLEFGYLEREYDVFNYQGSEYARIVFDESTMFSENQVRTMYTCLRSPVEGIQRQLLLTTNPIGPGFGWHRLLFIKPPKQPARDPYTIYQDARWPSDEKEVKTSTCFIPAKVWDNPTLLSRDPDYPRRLESQLGAVTEALLNGSWEQNVNIALDFDPVLHCCDPKPIPDWATRWVAIDWGKEDKACAVWLADDGNRVYAYRDFARPGKEIKPFAYEVLQMCKNERIAFVVLSHECFSDHGTGHSQADQFMEVFGPAEINVLKSDRDAEGRLMLIREYLRTTPAIAEERRAELDYKYWMERFAKEGTGAIAEYQRLVEMNQDGLLPKMLIFRPGPDVGCPYLIQSMPLLIVDVDRPKRLASGQDDHGFDALGYGLKAHMGGAAMPASEIYRQQLGGRIPDSELLSDLAMKHAREVAEEADSIHPVRWPMERHGRR